jgi:hypothetical protein
MKRQLLLGILGALVLTMATSVMTLTPPSNLIARANEDVLAQLQDGEGNSVGEVRLSQDVEDQVDVRAIVHDLLQASMAFMCMRLASASPPSPPRVVT